MNERDASGTPLALTIRQPWVSAVIWGGKDTENRAWQTGFRGRLLIHAGSACDPGWRRSPMADVIAAIPREQRTLHGLIIGSVELVDVVAVSVSPWAEPGYRWHWVLTDPVPLAEPVPARGQRRLWMPPEGSLL